jgi:3',5'-cyclic AMP phosphodiesterase CpdA
MARSCNPARTRLNLLVLACLLLLAACGARFRQPHTPVDAAAPPAGAWTLVALPDTQIAVENYPEIVGAQMAWIVANAERLNIKYVVHEGDITHNASDEQWATVDRAFRMLDGRVPYALALGNHDYPGSGGKADRRDTSKFDAVFPPSRLQAQPGFAGMRDPASGVNAAYRFEANGQDWLILTLEFGPRDTVLDWAASVLAAHATSNAIVVTHAYLFTDGTRFDHVAGKDQYNNPHDYDDGQMDGVNDGQEMWDKLIAKSPSIRFVLCGHMHDQAVLTSPRDSAPPVHQILADYQDESLGGEGHLRLMTFTPDGQVEVKTYSPYLQEFRDDPDNDFFLEL